MLGKGMTMKWDAEDGMRWDVEKNIWANGDARQESRPGEILRKLNASTGSWEGLEIRKG